MFISNLKLKKCNKNPLFKTQINLYYMIIIDRRNALRKKVIKS